MKSISGGSVSSGEMSLPVRGAWIEIANTGATADSVTSLPVRGAWIEMSRGIAEPLRGVVAPRAGSVD